MRYFKISLLLLGIAISGSTKAQYTSEMFVTPTTDAIPYRIPAIGTMKDGTVVGVADYRHCRSDIGFGKIDLHVRTSKDNGKTWGEIICPEVMTGDGNMTTGHQKAGYGDPCIVCDRTSKRILVTSCSGLPNFFAGDRHNHQGWARFYSEDGGKTWTEPQYIEEEQVYKPLDNSPYSPARGMFVGSGKITQSRYIRPGKYYRLYAAIVVNYSKDKGFVNFVLYSDDFGMNWHFLGGTQTAPIQKGDEPKVEELPNGNVLLSSRCWGGRLFNIFTYDGDPRQGKGSWATQAFSGQENNGTTANQNACNGEVMLVPVTRQADGAKCHIMLQSLPLGPNRSNVGIYYKDLADPQSYQTPQKIAADWTGCKQISYKGSAYSTMTMLKDNAIGFAYEEETHCDVSGGGFTIVFKHLTIEELTDNKYTYRKVKKGL